MAPWGKGKTSLMRFIEKKINGKVASADKRDTTLQPTALSNWSIWKNLGAMRKMITDTNKLAHPTIWFNAWKFQKNEQIWAGLAHEIISQLTDKLSPVEREKFYLRLNLKRIDEDKVRQSIILNAISKLFLPFLFGLAATLIAIILQFLTLFKNIDLLPGSSLMTGLSVFIFSGAYKIVKYFQRGPGADIAQYIRHPDYKKEMGYYANMEADLKDVLNLLVEPGEASGNFIDDLDRCSPSTISELIEAINLFISGDVSSCYFVVGQDAQVVAASLDITYDKIADKLGDVVGKRHGSVGWFFMEKFIQLQFNLPVISEEQSGWILRNLLSTMASSNSKIPDPTRQTELLKRYDILESNINNIDDPDLLFSVERDELEAEIILFNPLRIASFNDKVLNRVFSSFIVEESELENVVNAVAPYLNNSPRIMKRFANLYIFYQFMKYSNTCRALRALDPDALSCWLLVMIRWPQLVRAIQWENEKDFLAGSDAYERAGDFQQLIESSVDFEAYLKKIQSRKIAADAWPSNEELFKYFKNKRISELKLSDAVVCGLW